MFNSSARRLSAIPGPQSSTRRTRSIMVVKSSGEINWCTFLVLFIYWQFAMLAGTSPEHSPQHKGEYHYSSTLQKIFKFCSILQLHRCCLPPDWMEPLLQICQVGNVVLTLPFSLHLLSHFNSCWAGMFGRKTSLMAEKTNREPGELVPWTTTLCVMDMDKVGISDARKCNNWTAYTAW